MSAQTLRLRRTRGEALHGWRGHGMALAGLWAALLLAFARDAADMAVIWWTNSTFGHCLIVLPLIGWLAHIRMPALRAIEPEGWPPGLAWLAPGALAWLLGDASGLGVARHAGLVVMMQGALAAMLGREAVRLLAFPLAYAFFLVPMGAEIVPALQILTARLAMAMLGWVGVPAYLDGIFITTATGYFKVAEACAGAKFVIAMAAYAVLVGHLCFRRWGRRCLFFGAAIAIAILANGVRAFATILVAHRTGIDAALGFDHVVYGGIFFALVIALVMAAAWPFFDRSPLEQPVATGHGGIEKPVRSSLLLAALLLILAPPLWSHAASRATSAPLPAALKPPVVPGWRIVRTSMAYPWQPRFDGADRLALWRYADGRGRTVDLALAAYGAQQEGRELVGYGQGAVDERSEWSWSAAAPAPAGAKGARITAPGPVVRQVWSFYRIGTGDFTGDAARVKLETMRARLLGADQRALAILLSAEDGRGQRADEAMRDFARALGRLDLLADEAAGNR